MATAAGRPGACTASPHPQMPPTRAQLGLACLACLALSASGERILCGIFAGRHACVCYLVLSSVCPNCVCPAAPSRHPPYCSCGAAPFANPEGPPFLDSITFAYCDEESLVCSTSVIANSTATHATTTSEGVVTELGGCATSACQCQLGSCACCSCAGPVVSQTRRCPTRAYLTTSWARLDATPHTTPACLLAGRYTSWQCADTIADPGAYYAAVSLTLIHPNGTAAAARQLCEYGLVDLATNTHYW